MLGVLIIAILVLIVLSLISYSILQIKLAGINIKDFFSFINATKELERLYKFSKIYEKMNPVQQVVFLSEAEKMFSAFEKVPCNIWEDDYSKYAQILDVYKNIKILRWANSNI